MSAKRLFIAATRQNDGKTMTSLGLYNAFQKRFKSITYMKPVGQQFLMVNGEKIDKDAVLFSKVYNIQDSLAKMSPIAVPKGFTEDYIDHPHPKEIHDKILQHFNALAKDKEFVLIEGTGHAGVGSVFDASNADVAKLLGTKVVLVSLGGIGRCIDEILLNKACFDLMGVEIAGVIINKVIPDKYDKTVSYLEKGLAHKGIRFLGAIPYVNMLSSPLMRQLQEGLGADVLSGEDQLDNRVGKVLIGAMDSTDALDYFEKDTVLVVPGNREAIIMTALFGNLLKKKVDFNISGIVFTGGIGPDDKIFQLIKHTKIPMLLVPDDSYSVATRINSMLVKLRAEETEKIEKIQYLVEKHVDVDEICRVM